MSLVHVVVDALFYGMDVIVVVVVVVVVIHSLATLCSLLRSSSFHSIC